MIEPARIASWLSLKQRLAGAFADPDSGLRPSLRERSEGLARHCEIDGKLWTYATDREGYAFTTPEGGVSVLVTGDPDRDTCFTAVELLAWIRAEGGHDNITQFVVDNWLVRAELAGVIARVEDRRGCWRLASAA